MLLLDFKRSFWARASSIAGYNTSGTILLPEPLYSYLNRPTPASFCLFSFFKHKFYRKTVCLSRIRIWMAGLEGEHADHLTTTTYFVFALLKISFLNLSLLMVSNLSIWSRHRSSEAPTRRTFDFHDPTFDMPENVVKCDDFLKKFF